MQCSLNCVERSATQHTIANAHTTLDRAVWSADGWPEPPKETDDETILARLLALNLERADG
jgi:hypothetical protein